MRGVWWVCVVCGLRAIGRDGSLLKSISSHHLRIIRQITMPIVNSFALSSAEGMSPTASLYSSQFIDPTMVLHAL